jgi:GDPmannose 4,6-dehydratase
MKRALITGIYGQDGRFLNDFLTRKGYEVFGFAKSKNQSHELTRLSTIDENRVFVGNFLNQFEIEKAIATCQPHEIYNLAGKSFVFDSYKNPFESSITNALGIGRIKDSIRNLKLQESTKIYQASSSELFGGIGSSPQNESTKFLPTSPYGIAKQYAHQMSDYYRNNFNIFVSCGILYNHESEIRPSQFLSRKVTKGLAQIKLGLSDELVLGNLDSMRDWGYAEDYVEAMWLMLQQNEPENFVIATNQSRTVKEFVRIALDICEIDKSIEQVIRIDSNLAAKTENTILLGDATKAREILGWVPKVTFREMIERMLKFDLETESMKAKNQTGKILGTHE